MNIRTLLIVEAPANDGLLNKQDFLYARILPILGDPIDSHYYSLSAVWPDGYSKIEDLKEEQFKFARIYLERVPQQGRAPQCAGEWFDGVDDTLPTLDEIKAKFMWDYSATDPAYRADRIEEHSAKLGDDDAGNPATYIAIAVDVHE